MPLFSRVNERVNRGKLRRRVRASTEKGWIRVSPGKVRITASVRNVESG